MLPACPLLDGPDEGGLGIGVVADVVAVELGGELALEAFVTTPHTLKGGGI